MTPAAYRLREQRRARLYDSGPRAVLFAGRRWVRAILDAKRERKQQLREASIMKEQYDRARAHLKQLLEPETESGNIVH